MSYEIELWDSLWNDLKDVKGNKYNPVSLLEKMGRAGNDAAQFKKLCAELEDRIFDNNKVVLLSYLVLPQLLKIVNSFPDHYPFHPDVIRLYIKVDMVMYNDSEKNPIRHHYDYEPYYYNSLGALKQYAIRFIDRDWQEVSDDDIRFVWAAIMHARKNAWSSRLMLLMDTMHIVDYFDNARKEEWPSI